MALYNIHENWAPKIGYKTIMQAYIYVQSASGWTLSTTTGNTRGCLSCLVGLDWVVKVSRLHSSKSLD